MYLQVNDGRVIFATHFVRAVLDKKKRSVRDTLWPFQEEAEGIVCYSKAEVEAATTTLTKLGIRHVVEPQNIAPLIEAEARVKQYNTRTDAMERLTQIKQK